LNIIHQVVLQKRLEQLKTRQLKEAEKEKAELAAVLAIQSQDVEGDVRGLREIDDQDMEYAVEGNDQDMDGVTPTAILYDRAMSPEPIDTLAREDQNFAIVDSWDDWAEVVNGVLLLLFLFFSCPCFIGFLAIDRY
jgi:hypothetical protein